MSGNSKEAIQDYLEKSFLISFDGGDYSEESNLFEEGVIDSYGLVELVGFLESTFEIYFTDEELLSPDLTTLKGMSSFVDKKRDDANG